MMNLKTSIRNADMTIKSQVSHRSHQNAEAKSDCGDSRPLGLVSQHFIDSFRARSRLNCENNIIKARDNNSTDGNKLSEDNANLNENVEPSVTDLSPVKPMKPYQEYKPEEDITPEEKIQPIEQQPQPSSSMVLQDSNNQPSSSMVLQDSNNTYKPNPMSFIKSSDQ